MANVDVQRVIARFKSEVGELRGELILQQEIAVAEKEELELNVQELQRIVQERDEKIASLEKELTLGQPG